HGCRSQGGAAPKRPEAVWAGDGRSHACCKTSRKAERGERQEGEVQLTSCSGPAEGSATRPDEGPSRCQGCGHTGGHAPYQAKSANRRKNSPRGEEPGSERLTERSGDRTYAAPSYRML